MDKLFIAKFLYSVDERLYIWLKECLRSNLVDETNTSLVQFQSIMMDVQIGSFHQTLPPGVVKRASADSDHRDKRQKQPSMVKNHSLEANLRLKADEAFKTVFGGLAIRGPNLSTHCKPCLKWHVKGVCWDDCDHKASHKNLMHNNKKLLHNYVKSIRGN